MNGIGRSPFMCMCTLLVWVAECIRLVGSIVQHRGRLECMSPIVVVMCISVHHGLPIVAQVVDGAEKHPIDSYI